MTNLNIKHNPYWARSAGNQNIALYRSMHFEENKNLRPIVIIGGVHGDEPEGVYLAENCLTWLKKTSQTKPDLIKIPWIVIPCINPDGYRQNRRVNANGVDLNRNYPSTNWSPNYQGNRYYPGPRPASEPEIVSLVNLMTTEKPRLVIHCHSWIPCIVFTGQPGFKDAERLAKAANYELQDHIGYPTPGSLSQYGWHDQKIPIICIEAPEKTPTTGLWDKFQPAFEQIFFDSSDRANIGTVTS